jgi:anti-sigma B factor antagonist
VPDASADGPAIDLETTVDGAVARVDVHGELDLHGAPRLINCICELAGQPIERIDLSCEHVAFVDSAGVRSLIVGRNEASRRGVGFAVVDASPPVSRVLDMTGLTTLLTHA